MTQLCVPQICSEGRTKSLGGGYTLAKLLCSDTRWQRPFATPTCLSTTRAKGITISLVDSLWSLSFFHLITFTSVVTFNPPTCSCSSCVTLCGLPSPAGTWSPHSTGYTDYLSSSKFPHSHIPVLLQVTDPTSTPSSPDAPTSLCPQNKSLRPFSVPVPHLLQLPVSRP